MKIEKHKVVTVTYILKENDENGEIIDMATAESPFSFIFGIGTIIKGFEDNLMGLEPGDDFRFTVNAENAYGNYRSDLVTDIPRSVFAQNGIDTPEILQKGNIIPMQDENGNQFEAIIKDFNDQTVTMDFNHPLAGKNLYFTGKVLEVRDATPEELQHGHVH